MKKLNPIVLIILHFIPAAISMMYFAGFFASLLAAAMLFVLALLNIFYSEKTWVSLVAMLVATALCVIAAIVSTQLYYHRISSDSETLKVGEIQTIGIGIFGFACSIGVLAAKKF